MFKAIIISREAIEYILQTIPKDLEGEMGEIGRGLAKAIDQLNRLKAKLEKERHDWSVKALDKCPCGDCDDETAENELRMENCLRDATMEEIKSPEVVYDKTAGVDKTNQYVATQPPSAKSNTEESLLNTLTTETPTSCVA